MIYRFHRQLQTLEAEVKGLCTWNEGIRLKQVFFDYYDGKEVKVDDLKALDVLSNTNYLEYYVNDGKVFARAGPVGKMFKKTDSPMPA